MTVRTFCKDPLISIANHKHLLILAAVITLVLGTGLYYIFEDYTLVQCLEWSAQTMTSTGYGNYPAQTVEGSLTSTFMMLWSVPLLLSLITAFIVENLRQSRDAYTHEEQEAMKNDIADIKRMLAERSLVKNDP